MKMQMLGSTGIRVSELCLGTMTFGGTGTWGRIGRCTQTDADMLIGSALDAGINFVDTADIYSGGLAEEMTGKALGPKRKNVILATKAYGRTGPGPNDIGSTRCHLIEACNASLKRLGTDYIDLYQLHNWDHETPIGQTLKALDDLVREGKVRYIGCSNFSGWQIMKSLALSEREGYASFVTSQSYYSLMARELEFEVVPVCLDQDLGILPWSPLAGGFLTGKYRKNRPRPGDSRRTDPSGNFLEFDEAKGFLIVEELDRISKEHGASVTQAALNYLLRKPAVSSVIFGVRTADQMADILKTSAWEMTPEEVNRLDALSKPPRTYPYWMQDFAKRDR